MLCVVADRIRAVHVGKLEGAGQQFYFPGHVFLQGSDMRVLEQRSHCNARTDHRDSDQGHHDEGEADAKRFHMK
ncbi:hypothetical protein D3C81_2015520 [compost metagenome]